MPATARAMARGGQAVSVHGMVPDRIIAGLAAVASTLLREAVRETGVGNGHNSAPAAYRDQGSVREDLRLSHAAMLLHLEGEHPAGGEPVSAHLAREG